MYHKSIVNIQSLGFIWPTVDPFLFCVHHHDHYPQGNDIMGPATSLSGRYLGQDFTPKDGWRMYHGRRIPGFPVHPHRGFETVTIVLKGIVDHSDSAGAAGRYGEGDVQWMTAGAGLQHCEMFPLLHQENDNELELFQIWINLPAKRKFVKPHFKMLWGGEIPKMEYRDANGRTTTIDMIAGTLEGITAPDPAPDSWAADRSHQVAIWNIRMEAGSQYILPLAKAEAHRMLYFFEGENLNVSGNEIVPMHAVELLTSEEVMIHNGNKIGRLLLLQGCPIQESVAQHGPFVMNTMEEIHQAIADYRTTQFGGWPWPEDDHVHPRDSGRFAKYSNGIEEQGK